MSVHKGIERPPQNDGDADEEGGEVGTGDEAESSEDETSTGEPETDSPTATPEEEET